MYSRRFSAAQPEKAKGNSRNVTVQYSKEYKNTDTAYLEDYGN